MRGDEKGSAGLQLPALELRQRSIRPRIADHSWAVQAGNCVRLNNTNAVLDRGPRTAAGQCMLETQYA